MFLIFLIRRLLFVKSVVSLQLFRQNGKRIKDESSAQSIAPTFFPIVQCAVCHLSLFSNPSKHFSNKNVRKNFVSCSSFTLCLFNRIWIAQYKNFSQLKQQNYIIHICITNTYLYNIHAYNTYTSFIKSDKSMRTYIFELCKNKKRIR